MGPKITNLSISIIKKIIDDCIEKLEELKPEKNKHSSESTKVKSVGEELVSRGLGTANTLKNLYYDYKGAIAEGEEYISISVAIIQKLEKFTGNRYYLDSDKSGFEKTEWFFYHYHKEKDEITNQKISGILKCYVQFGERNNVTLKSVFRGKEHIYWGKYKVIDGHILSMNLRLMPEEIRNLQIMVHVKDGRASEVSMGVFQNITDTGAIVSGTIIMNKIKDSDDLRIPEFISFENFEIDKDGKKYSSEKNIPFSIYEYLQTKESNLLKVQPNVSSIGDLDRLIIDYERVKKERLINPTKKHYHIFLSAPSTFSIPINNLTVIRDDKDYKKVVGDIRDIRTAIISKTKFSEICCLVDSNDLIQAQYELESLYDKMVSGIKNSERLLVIYHDILNETEQKSLHIKPSGIMIELGMALNAEKPCYLLHKRGVELPKFVRAARNKHLIKVSTYENLEELKNADSKFWEWFFRWD